MRIRSWRAAILGLFLCFSSAALAGEVPADILRQLPTTSDQVISTATMAVGPSRHFYLVAMAARDEAKFAHLPTRPPARSLWIFERRPADRYRFFGRNDDVILRPDDGGVFRCDPFEARTIAVKGVYFTVEQGVGCGPAHWTDYVTFRFDPRSGGFIFDNWRVESWSMNRSNDPNAEALVSDGQKVVRAKGRPVSFARWERPQGPTSRHCGLSDIEACGAMWDLVTRKDFIAALRKFLGPGKASWTMENWDKTDQVLTTLSVSSEDPTRIGDGLIRMGGCFPHNCPERAEVFFAMDGRIKAVALLYHDCGSKTCTGEEDYTLRILLRENSPMLVGHAKDWAEGDLRRQKETFPQFGLDKISRITVDILSN
jgi:hypothetical protein